MNVKKDDTQCHEGSECLSRGRFGTCGPGAAYPVQRPRRNVCRELRQSDMSGTGIEFDAQVSCWNTNAPPRRCAPANLTLDLPYCNSFS